MRQTLTILIIIFFASCGQKKEKTETAQQNLSADSINKTAPQNKTVSIETKTTKSLISEWQKHEDSLRNVILKSKENTILKKSFLQEMYIRNIVTISKGSLFVNIPFNLHGPDCEAPDCYSTGLSFRLTLGDTLIFPGSLPFHEHEHGCIEKESSITGSFQLLEQTNNYIIYHAAKEKRTLVLFNSNKENGTTAFYFTEVGQDTVNGKNINKIIKDYKEEDANSVYPFRSWILTTNEYENFIR